MNSNTKKELCNELLHICIERNKRKWPDIVAHLKNCFPKTPFKANEIIIQFFMDYKLKRFYKEVVSKYFLYKYDIVKIGVFTYVFDKKKNKWQNFEINEFMDLLDKEEIPEDSAQNIYDHIIKKLPDGSEGSVKLRNILIEFADNCHKDGGYFFSNNKAYKIEKDGDGVVLKEHDIPLWDTKKKQPIPYFQNLPFNKSIYNRLIEKGEASIDKDVLNMFGGLFENNSEGRLNMIALFKCTAKLLLRYSYLGLVFIIYNSVGRNGKSKYLELLDNLSPETSTSKSAINTIMKYEFDIITKIRNKTLIIQDEKQKITKEEIVFFKKTTSNLYTDFLKVKFGKPSMMIYPQNFVTSTNYTMDLEEDNDSIRARFKFMLFPKNFKGADSKDAMDPDKLDKLMRSKSFLEEVFTTSLYYLMAYKCKIENTKAMEELYNKNISSPIKDFLEWLLGDGKSKYYKPTELRDEYRIWKTESDMSIMDRRRLPQVSKLLKVLYDSSFSEYSVYKETSSGGQVYYSISKVIRR